MSLDVMQELLNAPTQADLAGQIEALGKKFDQLLRLAEDQILLQRVALLEEGHILRFHAPGGARVALSLPDAQDDYIQRVILKGHGFYEGRLLAQVRERGIVGPGSTVCDIGANIGNHAVHFAAVCGARRVLAFEPMAHCHATLSFNLDLNGLGQVATAYNCLIGAETGFARLAGFNPRNLGAASFVPAADGPIPMFALDDIMTADDLSSLDLIKIDVEGMQLDVLRGAEGVLAARRPALWIELLARDPSRAETEAFLARHGYRAEKLGPTDVLFRA